MPHSPEVFPHATDWQSVEIIRKESDFTPLNILLNGQGDFGLQVGMALEVDGHSFAGVIATKKEDDPLRMWAEERKIPIINLGTIDRPETAQTIKDLGAELGVMAFVTRTVSSEVASAPEHGTLQFHPSALPKRRGRSSQNRAIIEGDKTMGISIISVEDNGTPEELDSGPVVVATEVEIPEDITMSRMYATAVSPLGVVSMRDAVRKYGNEVGRARAEGRAVRRPYTPQDHSRATLEPPIEKSEVQVDFTKPAIEVHNMIRGAQNSPGAWMLHEGVVVNLFDSQRFEGPVMQSGVIESLSDDGATFATGQGLVRVGMVQEVRSVQEGDMVKEVKGPRLKPIDYFKS